MDIERLKGNAAFLKKILPSSCALMPAVKANAYGHGVLPVADALLESGVSHFCVASVSEGIELRRHGVKGEILILGYTAEERFRELWDYRLTQTVVDASYGEILAKSKRRILVHVGVDTGMHRLGETWKNLDRIAAIWEKKNLTVTGVFSHLSAPDGNTPEEVAFTKEQIRRFDEITAGIRKRGISGFKTHLQGSYGILNYPECSYDFARPGIAIYGVKSRADDDTKTPFEGKPVLSLKARVQCVKELEEGETAGYGLAFTAKKKSRIAVLSVGYADGIPREIAGAGSVLLRGERAPIVGKICMDQMFVDVTELHLSEQIGPYDEAVLIGESGELSISAEEFAGFAGTITNEILSRLGERLERCVC